MRERMSLNRVQLARTAIPYTVWRVFTPFPIRADFQSPLHLIASPLVPGT